MADDSGARRRRTIREIKTIAEAAVDDTIDIVPEVVDPTIVADPDISEDRGEIRDKPKRGRKPGSAKKASATISVSGLESLLMSVHMGLSAITSTPEFALDKSEAETLSKAGAAVARHYDVPGMPEKMIDWSNLLIALGMVYAPRFAAIRMRKSIERAEAKRNAQASVVTNLNEGGPY